ncbi:Ste24 endopeptidase [Alicycliphilus sp. B1]|nr:Ste24 endopeptidase [Alicycliphilus sp. B1]
MFTVFLTPLLARISRRHEFQADAYAVAQASGADLASALLKLYQDNASTLTPRPGVRALLLLPPTRHGAPGASCPWPCSHDIDVS